MGAKQQRTPTYRAPQTDHYMLVLAWTPVFGVARITSDQSALAQPGAQTAEDDGRVIVPMGEGVIDGVHVVERWHAPIEGRDTQHCRTAAKNLLMSTGLSITHGKDLREKVGELIGEVLGDMDEKVGSSGLTVAKMGLLGPDGKPL